MCLLDLIEDDGMGDLDESQEWVKLLDRGGLMHVHLISCLHTTSHLITRQRTVRCAAVRIGPV